MNFIVSKQNHKGDETWRYAGQVIGRGEDHIVIEAYFDRDDMDFHGMCLCKGDRFVETYYFDRWYNIFEIYDRDNQHLKGWYCNISSPAIETNDTISYRDLALDLLVFPDGRQIILDEDEFEALQLSPQDEQAALAALVDLQTSFKRRTGALK